MNSVTCLKFDGDGNVLFPPYRGIYIRLSPENAIKIGKLYCSTRELIDNSPESDITCGMNYVGDCLNSGSDCYVVVDRDFDCSLQVPGYSKCIVEIRAVGELLLSRGLISAYDFSYYYDITS